VINYIIMKSVMASHREILQDVQGSNVWSGQQIQSFNSDAIAWGALGKPLYAPGTRYAVREAPMRRGQALMTGCSSCRTCCSSGC
jgi:hypothetical protein